MKNICSSEKIIRYYIVCVLNNWFDRRTKEVFLKDSYYAHVAADSMEKY